MTFRQIQDQVIRRFKAGLRTDLKQWINARLREVWSLEEWVFKTTTASVTVTAGSRTLSNLPADIGIPSTLQDSDGDELDYLPASEFLRIYQGTTDTGAPEHWTRIGDVYYVGPTPDATASDYTLLYQRAVGFYPSTTMAETTTLPDATLTVASTAEFPSSGSAWVGAGARLISYTGKTPTTLTGCTGPAGFVLTSGDIVVSTTGKAGLLSADTDVPMLPPGTHMILVYLGQEGGAALESDPTQDSPASIADKLLAGMRREFLIPARRAGRQWGADPGEDWR
jgi:hypothetical protein